MEKKPFDHTFPYKDVPGVAETFADGVHLITADGSTLRMILTVSRTDAPKPSSKAPPSGSKVTAARVVMPLPVMAELYNQLDQLVRGLEAQGLLTRGGGEVKPTVQ